MINYELKRTKRKTVSISIKNGDVIVSAPLRASKELIDNFVNSKQNWINNKLKIFYTKQDKYYNALNYNTIFISGIELKLKFTNNVKRFLINAQAFEFLAPIKYFQANINNSENIVLQRALKNWYKKFALLELHNFLQEISLAIGLPYNSFSLTNANSKWGSCSSQNDIKLNYRLLMFPRNICNYVIIHELCHTKEHNHSQVFWNLVQKHCNDYKISKNELKERSVLNEIFR